MGNQQYGLSLLVQLTHEIHHLCEVSSVLSNRRLIQDQKRRLERQCGSQRGALLLSNAERSRWAVAQRAQVALDHQRLYVLVSLRPQVARAKAHLLFDRVAHQLVERVLL